MNKEETCKKAFLATFPYISEEDWDVLLPIARCIELDEKEVLISPGELANECYFLAEGMLRGVLKNETGDEYTVILRQDKRFTAPPEGLYGPQPTNLRFEGVIPSVVLALNFQEFEHLAYHHPNISRVFIEGIKENLEISRFRIQMLSGKKPQERYEMIMLHFPEFFQYAYHKDIAGFMGVTPVSLSRIIKRKQQERKA